jgi:hypothetical protein
MHGSSGREPALQTWSPDFKPQSHQKKKKKDTISVTCANKTRYTKGLTVKTLVMLREAVQWGQEARFRKCSWDGRGVSKSVLSEQRVKRVSLWRVGVHRERLQV